MLFEAIRPSGWLLAPIATAETPVKRRRPPERSSGSYIGAYCGEEFAKGFDLARAWQGVADAPDAASPAGRVYAKSIDQEIAQK
ncbi:uncharacterized protein N7496_012111 [Penicillium cataractarum]|uniref:Uncharacterized protein n=1 Tax=Penicillium cataractarum TaxID=2100454 RepID=A0A9W9RLE3_9EURO|nr:uncharacterized protein N7496_012111 [Penicillium cataractarum]KAJ5359698.1 hypothetical protein N7496_012111 [Penicillium cataractarum]